MATMDDRPPPPRRRPRTHSGRTRTRRDTDPALAELREAYASGQLILFVGAGVSAAAGLPGWPHLVDRLIEHARALKAGKEALKELREFKKQKRLIDALSAARKALGEPEFCTVVERSLNDENMEPPELARVIASLMPGLRAVLTTNIDHLLEKACAGKWPVLARATEDVARREKYILKFHGTLLERSTWCFTREDYDRVMYASPQLQGAFSALFHSCPLLFVGYGLADDDFDTVLGRVRAFAGSQPPRHFALMARGTVGPSKRDELGRAGVRIIEYDNPDGTHAEVVNILRQLASRPEPTTSTSNAVPPLQESRGATREAPELLPGKPARLIGRDAQLEDLVSTLLKEEVPPIPILGPAGIGKSTLSQAALYDARVVERYAERRFFVRCDTAHDVESLVARTALTVGVPPGTNQQERLLAKLGRAPTLLVLDNLETPWWDDEAHIRELEDFLRRLGSLGTLGLVASVRGKSHPLGPAWREPVELKPLGKEASRHVFLAIAGSRFAEDPDLEKILDALEGLPLAIELLAFVAQAASNLQDVWEVWNQKRTALLQRGPEREQNLETSFELSISSKRMTPEARRLLSILALLPGGVDRAGLKALPEQMDSLAAALTLQGMGLAFDDEHGRLRMLAPLREYVARYHRPEAADLDAIIDRYLQMARDLGPQIFHLGGGEALRQLSEERANLEPMTLLGLERAEPQSAIQAALALGAFMASSGLGSPRVLAGAREAARRVKDLKAEATCILVLGDIALERSLHEEAHHRFEEARPLFQQVADIRGEADCIRGLGDLALRRSQYEEARRRFEEARALFHQVGDVQGEAMCIASLGGLALRRSQPEEARRYSEEARPLFHQAGNLHSEAICIALLGELALRRSQPEEARRYFDEARALFHQTGDIQDEANCISQLGELALRHGQPEKAPLLFEEARTLFHQGGKLQGEAQCIKGLGDLALMRAQHEEAGHRFEEARTLFHQVGDIGDEAHCIVGLGNLALRRAQHEEARRLFEEARTLLHQVENLQGEANCVMGLGEIALSGFQHEEARRCFEEARTLFHQVGDIPGEAICIERLGKLALRRDQPEEARRYFEKARALFHQVGDVQGEAMCIASLGDLALRRSQYEEARRYSEEARTLFHQVGNLQGEAICIERLGELALRRDQPEEARRYFEEAQPLFQQVGDIAGEANCIKGLGVLALTGFQYEEAHRCFEEARTLFHQVGDIQGEAICIMGLGDLALASSQYEEARRRFEEALKLYEHIPELVLVGVMHYRLAQLASSKEERTAHARAAHDAWTQGGHNDFVEALDREFSEESNATQEQTSPP